MLTCFYAENYRNLNFSHPMVLGASTVVYGICAAGKSNLCKAIADIVKTYVPDEAGEPHLTHFYYGFQYEMGKLSLQYTRDCDGIIRVCKITCKRNPYKDVAYKGSACDESACEGTAYSVVSYQKTVQAVDCIKNIRSLVNHDLSDRGGAKMLLDCLLHEIEHVSVVIDETPVNDKSVTLCRSKQLYPECTHFENSALVICDDGGSYEDVLKLAHDKKTPLLYTARTPSFAVKWCDSPENCYFISRGQIYHADFCTPKDIRNAAQLKNFLQTIQ